jgi:hypothetical protein
LVFHVLSGVSRTPIAAWAGGDAAMANAASATTSIENPKSSRLIVARAPFVPAPDTWKTDPFL